MLLLAWEEHGEVGSGEVARSHLGRRQPVMKCGRGRGGGCCLGFVLGSSSAVQNWGACTLQLCVFHQCVSLQLCIHVQNIEGE